jgi:hypothetical protein
MVCHHRGYAGVSCPTNRQSAMRQGIHENFTSKPARFGYRHLN